MKKYLPFITVITLIYLIVELAFNARLLDITSVKANTDNIHSIEIYGRIISGIALTLAVWGIVALPIMDKKRVPVFGQGIILFIISVPLMIGTYLGEDHLVNNIALHSTGEERKQSVLLNLMKTEIASGKIQVSNMDLSDKVIQSPSGKTFIALLPFLGLMDSHMTDKMNIPVSQAIHNIVSDEMGNDVTFYNHKYKQASQDALDQYEVYQNFTKENYKENVEDLTGKIVPPNLTFEQFQMLPKIQEKASKTLNIKPPVELNKIFNEYQSLYKRGFDEAQSQIQDTLLHTPDDYMGKNAQEGIDAVKAIIAPALALTLSVVGAFVHIFKVSNYVTSMMRVPFRKVGILLILFGGLGYAFFVENSITQSHVYQTIESNANHSSKNRIALLFIKETIHIQPYFYPVNEAIRSALHLSFE